MSVLATFQKATRSRVCGLALAMATLFGVSSAQSQTVSANFAGRNGATKPVPAGLFGVGGTGSTVRAQAPVNLLTTAGLNQTRFWISLTQVYATSTPNFAGIDSTLTIMRASGLHPLAVIYDTPRSLGSRSCSPPSNPWKWGQMAASVVAHVDRYFPGVLQDYEIWNEPELAASLCAGSETAQLNSYISMFAAAGSAMHAQARSDGETIRVGGPAISQLSQASTWIPALLRNSSTAPYVNFVSFHLYITGLTDIQKGMNWSQLYAITQSSTHGLAHYYHLIEPLVRAGHQPNAWSTPIYLTEYNDNWAYAVECCRNNPTYGPLWNSVAVADLLNTVYSGASAVPSKLNYFNSAGKYFCMIGQWDSAMDCNTSAQYPYPQFYAFKLFAASQYLDLQAGGHMAASVSPASTTSGLMATAFYTGKGDNVVVINPTSTAYGAVNVTFSNPGLAASEATVYLLNSSHSQITTEYVKLSPVSGGYSARVPVPAYSTMAVSLN
jgi:hypothetical protein